MSLTITEYFKLTKPGVLYLLMITAGASMVLATNFNLNLVKALTGFIGIAFIAGSSAAINQILDFKYDSVMERTVKRPIVTGKISVTSATLFASFLFITGSALILYFNNFLTWALTFGTWIFYAFFYTKVLKFSGSQNIVIGGLAGAMPPLLGWTAVVGSIDPLPLLLVLLIFIWTPPHFWALASIKRRICKSWNSDDACGQRYRVHKDSNSSLFNITNGSVATFICNWIFWLCLSDWSSNSWRNIHTKILEIKAKFRRR